MFGIFCVLGALFNYFFVAETKGLSEKEKKSLYIPGAKYGRKLRHEEAGTKYMRLSIKERSLSISTISDKRKRKSTLIHSSSRMHTSGKLGSYLHM